MHQFSSREVTVTSKSHQLCGTMWYWYLQVISLWACNYHPISSPIHFFPADIRTQGCGQPVSVEKRAPASAYWDTKVVIINSRNNPETTTLPFQSWVMAQDVWRSYSAQKDYIIDICIHNTGIYIYIYIFTVTLELVTGPETPEWCP